MTPRNECVFATALFTTAASSFPAAALGCAQDFADLLGAELHVLRLLSTRHSALLSRFVPFVDRDMFASFVGSARDATAECAEALSERYVDERVYVQVGELLEAAAAQADELRAQLLMVPGTEALGSQVTRLVRSTGLSVLVVRPAGVGTAILAATDLVDLHCPVLHRMAELAGRCRTRLIALHAMPAHSRALARGGSKTRDRQQRLEAMIRARLARAASLGSERAEPRLAIGVDPVDAILREAQTCYAGLLVVGTGARSELRRAMRPSVAARLIEEAGCSVLVTPVGENVRTLDRRTTPSS
jgi:nucleotide-binding universal stress UspA family protein